MSHLIPVTKDGEYIEVSPATLEEHKGLGWAVCEPASRAPDDKPRRGRKAKDEQGEQDERDDE